MTDIYVAILGDTHGKVGLLTPVLDALRKDDIKWVVQVGDHDAGSGRYTGWMLTSPFWQAINQWLLEDDERRWYFIDGNHDNHWLRLRLTEMQRINGRQEEVGAPVSLLDTDAGISDRLRYLPRGECFILGGMHCLAIGGGISVDRARRTVGHDYWPEEGISFADASKAVGELSTGKHNGNIVDIVFSHEAPGDVVWNHVKPWNISPTLQRAEDQQRWMLYEVLLARKPRHWFHGHYHVRYDDLVVTPEDPSRGTRVHGIASTNEGMPDCVFLLVVPALTMEVPKYK